MTNVGGYTALTDLHDLLVLTRLDNFPQVENIYDEKTIGIVEDQKEAIFLKLDNEKVDYYLHADDTFHTVSISIDIWTYVSLDRLNDLVSAIFNQIKTNARFFINNNSYSDLLVIGQHPLSDKYRNLWRHVIDVQVRKINP